MYNERNEISERETVCRGALRIEINEHRRSVPMDEWLDDFKSTFIFSSSEATADKLNNFREMLLCASTRTATVLDFLLTQYFLVL